MIELRLVEYEWTDGTLGCIKERLEYRWKENIRDDFWKITDWKPVPIVKLESSDE